MEQVKPETPGGKQTDLAEGEPETVEESLRIHERKGDLPAQVPTDEENHAA